MVVASLRTQEPFIALNGRFCPEALPMCSELEAVINHEKIIFFPSSDRFAKERTVR